MKRTIFKSCLLMITTLLLSIESCSATFVVSSNANAGANTLRQAIIDANASPGLDNINFNFGGATTITLTACQQLITGPVIIDGYTNPGAGAGTLMIEVISPAGCNGFDFGAGSDGSTIRGIVISGGTTGIYLHHSNGHTVRGNYVGTNMAGTAMAAARPTNGIHSNLSDNNTFGGTGGQIDRNLISAAVQTGLRLEASKNAVVIGNYVGTDVTGNVALGNGEHGIYGYTGSHNPRVGGTTNAERNLVCSNFAHGIFFNACTSAVVKGNICGIGINGTTKLGNGGSGISLEYVGASQVGGLTVPERNYSSNNGAFGVVVRNSDGTVIQGNWLGVDMATGLLDHGNYDAAITVTTSADVIIGGSVPGAGNVCSASGNPGGGADGISIWSNSPRPIIKGNIIGLGVDGTTSLQNYGHGIECVDCADGIIGGPTVLERNVVASSFLIGLQLVNSPRIRVVNNYVGTDVTGMLDRGGSQLGVAISNSANSIVGTGVAGEGNLISGNAQSGILVNGTSAGTSIKGNIIGLAIDGTTVIRNDESGIRISGNSVVNNCIVGGATLAEGNIISGNGVNNGHHALSIDGGSSGHIVRNNYIGTDINGNVAKGNTGTGIFINNCTSITIDQNISSNNGNKGIELVNASSITVTRNKIGTDVSGTLAMGNTQEGIRFSANAQNNIIGGSLANANIITDNKANSGNFLEGNGAQRNTITFNSIYCNTALGIDLNSTSNESVPAPVVSVSNANMASGTGVNGNTIHLYRNEKVDGGVKCNCEGEIYIGTTVVAGGVWSITHNLGLSAALAAAVTATQTTTNGSTSEFSACTMPLPVQLVNFSVEKSEGVVYLSWSTSSEINNDHFEVQHSVDGINFVSIGTLSGHGNSSVMQHYFFTDENPFNGVNYYRLIQVDYDGQRYNSEIKSIDFSAEFTLAAVPEGFQVWVPGNGVREVTYEVYSVTGVLVKEGKTSLSSGEAQTSIKLSLAPAVYLVVASFEGISERMKILIVE